MTVPEMQAFLRLVLSPVELQRWLQDQKEGRRPSWNELAAIYTAKGL